MNIVAVDPGGMTGVAWRRADDEVTVAEMPLQMALDAIWEQQQAVAFDAIVCERFTVTQRTIKLGRQYDALEGVGVLRWMSRQQLRTRYQLQAPSDVKRLITDTRLKEFGMYHPSPGGHMNDACRHLAYFEWKARTEGKGEIVAR